jgi:hypothetical protein
VHSTKITFVAWYGVLGKNSTPQNPQQVDFDGEHEHYSFEPFCKAPAPTSAISTSTSILRIASNPNSIYFDEISSTDNPRHSYFPHTSKAGNLPLRFFQQLAIFDCYKVVLIWIGSGRYHVSVATWLSGCLEYMYILGYPVRIIGPDCGIEGIVREVMSSYCCHLCAELRWSFRMVQGTCVIEELEE